MQRVTHAGNPPAVEKIFSSHVGENATNRRQEAFSCELPEDYLTLMYIDMV